MYLYWILLLFVVLEFGIEFFYSFFGIFLNLRWWLLYYLEDFLGKFDCVILYLYYNWDIFLLFYKFWKKKLKNEFDLFFFFFIVL